jgi:hypothetical protein
MAFLSFERNIFCWDEIIVFLDSQKEMKMIELEDKLISEEIFTKQFVCNLSACKGACCVEGDAGAPLESEEKELIEQNLEKIVPFMRPEGINKVKAEGVAYADFDGELVTSLVNNKECAFVFFDETNTAKCAIEKSYREGNISFNKPISCHLYPIRVKKLKYYDALDYNRWDICSPACALGEELKVPVYKFLKEPLITKYGSEFYEKLELVGNELLK